MKLLLHFSKIIFCICAIFFSACKEEKHTTSTNFPISLNKKRLPPTPATLNMNNEIKKIIENISPMEVGYILNGKRTEILEQKIKTGESKEYGMLMYTYGNELLRSGKTDESIKIFEDFLNYFETKPIPDKANVLIEFKKLLAIGHLRKAEQENCINNHTNESCIIPISENAQHKLTSGSESAIKILTEILSVDPTDYEAQYLLNIANMTLGRYPDKVPELFRIPESYFNKNADFPKFTDIAMQLGVNVNEMSGGTCIDDFNNDGYLDIIASSWGLDDQIRLFENDKNGGFIDRTLSAGLEGVTGGLNLRHGDFNNDGNLDFIILRGAWLANHGKIPNSLIKNNGDGTFEDVTKEAGIYSLMPTQTAIWADYNLDGWIDLFIANESTPKGVNKCELFLNNKNGTFTNIANSSGLNKTGFFKGAASGDVNNDGYPDIYLSNYNGENVLYLNSGKTNTITFEQAIDANVTEPYRSFSTWMFDYDNDGLDDIFVSGYSNEEMSPAKLMMASIKDGFKQNKPFLYKNNGNGTFTDVATAVGLTEPSTTMGCNFGDLDNDGFQDFYLATGTPSFLAIVPNKMYRNNKGKTFEDVTYSGGFGHIQKGHAIGFGDLDMDGDQDIYAVMGGAYEGDNFQNVLFENPMGSSNNWINIILRGTKSNRMAIGAKIIITIEENEVQRTIHRTIGADSSFGGNSLMAEIGLGKSKFIRELKIIWPNVTQDFSIFKNIEINRTIKIEEGTDSISDLYLKPLKFKKNMHSNSH